MKLLSVILSWMSSPWGEAKELKKCFPVLSFLIMRPQVTLIISACAAVLLRTQSPVLALAPFCLWTILLAFYLERRVIDRILFPPFTAVTCWAALGTGVGIPIMDWQIQNALRMTGFGVGDWHPTMRVIQLVYLFSFPMAWIGYYYGGFRSVPQLTKASLFDGVSTLMQQKISVLGWVLFVFAVFTLVVTVIGGFDSRSQLNKNGFNTLHVILHYAFALAPKWGMLGFFFVPRLWSEGEKLGRSAVLILLGLYFCTALATGSRGLLLYPCCMMVVGGYFFRLSGTWKTEMILFALAVIGFVSVFLIYVYRQSDQYVSSTARDLPARYRAFNDSVIHCDRSKWKPETIFDLGYSFFGMEDALIYARTPSPLANVGFSGFNAIPLTWIPTTLAKNKPKLLDSEMILIGYDMPAGQATGLSISLTADSYRRFGWVGIPIVVLAAFAIYGALIRWMLTWWRHGSLWGWALLFFTMTFFWSRPFGTILTTWWTFFYDTPKQLLATAILCFFVSRVVESISSRKTPTVR